MFMLAVKRKVTFHKISHRPQGEFNIEAWVTDPKASGCGLKAHSELTWLCSADAGGGEECRIRRLRSLGDKLECDSRISSVLSHAPLPYHTGRTVDEHMVASSPLCHWRTEQEETLKTSQRSIASDSYRPNSSRESEALGRWPCFSVLAAIELLGCILPSCGVVQNRRGPAAQDGHGPFTPKQSMWRRSQEVCICLWISISSVRIN